MDLTDAMAATGYVFPDALVSDKGKNKDISILEGRVHPHGLPIAMPLTETWKYAAPYSSGMTHSTNTSSTKARAAKPSITCTLMMPTGGHHRLCSGV